MTHDKLIRRARELAKLAEKATPGPWRAHCDEMVDGAGVRRSYSITHERYGGPDVLFFHERARENARLAAAAPDMARLLDLLANSLELALDELSRYRGRTMY